MTANVLWTTTLRRLSWQVSSNTAARCHRKCLSHLEYPPKAAVHPAPSSLPKAAFVAAILWAGFRDGKEGAARVVVATPGVGRLGSEPRRVILAVGTPRRGGLWRAAAKHSYCVGLRRVFKRAVRAVGGGLPRPRVALRVVTTR